MENEKSFYWWMVTAQFTTEDEKGKQKTTKENYMVKGASNTDASTQVTIHLGELMQDFRVINTKEVKITEVILPDGIELNDN